MALPFGSEASSAFGARAPCSSWDCWKAATWCVERLIETLIAMDAWPSVSEGE